MSIPPSRPRRAVNWPVPRRLAIVDSSMLTTDVIAGLTRYEPSSVVAAMRSGTIRGFAPHNVWAEVPRVLADRHREGETFDLVAAETLWWKTYVPLLHFVCTDRLPMTTQAETLALEDASDVGALQLAGVLAPVAVLATDNDLRRSGLAHPDWVQVRAALGRIGVAEQDFQAMIGAASLPVQGAVVVAGKMTRFARANPVAAAAIAAVLTGGALYYRHRNPDRFAELRAAAAPYAKEVAVSVAGTLNAQIERHSSGELVWEDAERGTAGDDMLHQVARLLACAPGPMTRTEILKELGPQDRRHRDLLAGLLAMLQHYPMFCEVSPGRWQIGRTNVGARLYTAV